jgi:hypothetical protein
MGDDGYVVFWPEGKNGAFTAINLRDIADELDRRNAAWDTQVQTDPAIAAHTSYMKGDVTGLVERLRRESQSVFPQRMRDGHAYHSTASALDKAADTITLLQEEVERLREAGALALGVAESWIHDQLDGTGMFHEAMAELDPARAALKGKG